MKNIFIAMFILSNIACTNISKLEFEVKPENHYEFNNDDIKLISEGLLKTKNIQRAEQDNMFFLNKSGAYWDILTLNNTDNIFTLEVQRISKYLKKFSPSWVESFVAGMKSIIQLETNINVDLIEIPPNEPLKKDEATPTS